MLEGVLYLFAPFVWLYLYLRPGELIWRMKISPLVRIAGCLLCVVAIAILFGVSTLLPMYAVPINPGPREIRALMDNRLVFAMGASVIFNWLVYCGYKIVSAPNKSLKVVCPLAQR